MRAEIGGRAAVTVAILNGEETSKQAIRPDVRGEFGARFAVHEGESAVDEGLARRLVDAQFPAWAGQDLAIVRTTGTDAVIARLGDDLVLRFPRVGWAVQQVEREATWLPWLAPQLRTSIPSVVARGRPALGYPFPWLVSRWIEGLDALHVHTPWAPLVADLAEFVKSLWSIDASHAPRSGLRGGPLEPHAEAVRAAIAVLKDELDGDAALAVWDRGARAAPWRSEPVWVHGDLLPGNVLVRDGALAGVIDWSSAGRGDPSCETMLAWSMDAASRAAFRDALDVDDATWARGRAWTLQQAVLFIPYYATTIPLGVAAARARLAAVLEDPTTAP